MPPVGFEPTVPAGEWPQTYALDRAATGTGLHLGYCFHYKDGHINVPVSSYKVRGKTVVTIPNVRFRVAFFSADVQTDMRLAVIHSANAPENRS